MGHEYKITANFSRRQMKEIETLLIEQLHFTKSYSEEKDIFEFRDHHIPPNKMPYSHIEFDDDGIYVRNNLHVSMWTHIQSLKTYLEQEKIAYKITDYGD